MSKQQQSKSLTPVLAANEYSALRSHIESAELAGQKAYNVWKPQHLHKLVKLIPATQLRYITFCYTIKHAGTFITNVISVF
jgi:hypothetical protein